MEELGKIADFIARHQITMTVENVATAPNREEEKPEKGVHRVYWSRWKCTFKRGEGEHAPTLETYYSMGHGNHESKHRREAAIADAQAGRLILTDGRNPLTTDYAVEKLAKAVCGPCRALNPNYADSYGPHRPDGQHKGIPPTVAAVLDSVASDAQCADNAATYEDFANELGYDPDSRKGERVYQACRKIADDLRRFLGNVDYDFLLYKVERE